MCRKHHGNFQGQDALLQGSLGRWRAGLEKQERGARLLSRVDRQTGNNKGTGESGPEDRKETPPLPTGL